MDDKADDDLDDISAKSLNCELIYIYIYIYSYNWIIC